MPLALTLGEPAGIGPDITLAAWRRRAEFDLAPFYLLADPALMQRRAERIAPDVPIAVIEPGAAPPARGRPSRVADRGRAPPAGPGGRAGAGAAAAVEASRRAARDVGSGTADAVVTNPVAKNILYQSGFAEPGHTEYLGKLAAAM